MVKVLLEIPENIHKKLKARADKSLRSTRNEIIFILQQSVKDDETPLTSFREIKENENKKPRTAIVEKLLKDLETPKE